MSSNVKISENQKTTVAIITLASDIASVFSIIHAADANSDIFMQAKISLEEANKIAYKAEKGIFDLTEIKKVVENISKLANTVYRKKEINPLISDELISILKKTVIDSENVVKLATSISY